MAIVGPGDARRPHLRRGRCAPPASPRAALDGLDDAYGADLTDRTSAAPSGPSCALLRRSTVRTAPSRLTVGLLRGGRGRGARARRHRRGAIPVHRAPSMPRRLLGELRARGAVTFPAAGHGGGGRRPAGWSTPPVGGRSSCSTVSVAVDPTTRTRPGRSTPTSVCTSLVGLPTRRVRPGAGGAHRGHHGRGHGRAPPWLDAADHAGGPPGGPGLSTPDGPSFAPGAHRVAQPGVFRDGLDYLVPHRWGGRPTGGPRRHALRRARGRVAVGGQHPGDPARAEEVTTRASPSWPTPRA